MKINQRKKLVEMNYVIVDRIKSLNIVVDPYQKYKSNNFKDSKKIIKIKIII